MALDPTTAFFFVCSLPSPSWVPFDLSSHSSLCVADVKLEGDVNCQLVDPTRFNLSSPDQKSVTVGRFFPGKKITTTTWDSICGRICLICASSRTLYGAYLTGYIDHYCIKQLQIRMSYICVPNTAI